MLLSQRLPIEEQVACHRVANQNACKREVYRRGQKAFFGPERQAVPFWHSLWKF